MGKRLTRANLIKYVTYKKLYRSIKDDALFKRLFRNSSYLFFSNVITGVLGFVQTIFIAKFLGVEQYGILALVMTYVMAVNQLLDFRVWEAVIKYVSEYCENKDRRRAWATIKLFYWIAFLTGLVAFLIAVLCAPLAARLLRQPEIAGLANIFALSLLLLTVNGTSRAILQVFDKFKWISIQAIMRAVTMLVLTVSVLFASYGIRGVLAAYVISSFLGTLVLSYFILRVLRSNLWNVRKEANILLLRGRFREIGWFMFHTNMSAFWGMVIRHFDVLILGYFRGPTEVGYFKLAKNFVLLIGKIYDPLYDSIFPEISKLWALGCVKKFNRFLYKLTIITSTLFLPIALAMFIFCGMVIKLTVGSEFDSAVLAVRIMILGVTIGCIFTWARPTVIAIGKPVIGNIASMTGAIMVLFLAIIFVPSYGYLASASLAVLNYAVGHIIVIGGYFYYLRQKTRVAAC